MNISKYLKQNGFRVSSIGPHKTMYQNGSAEVELPTWDGYHLAPEINQRAIKQIADIEGISAEDLIRKIEGLENESSHAW